MRRQEVVEELSASANKRRREKREEKGGVKIIVYICVNRTGGGDIKKQPNTPSSFLVTFSYSSRSVRGALPRLPEILT